MHRASYLRSPSVSAPVVGQPISVHGALPRYFPEKASPSFGLFTRYLFHGGTGLAAPKHRDEMVLKMSCCGFPRARLATC